ncbi:MAG: P-loop NTPase [Acidobacteriota bacterium]|nr:P-loop NTPase [Acidobacteriota bacterium]
MAETQHHPAGDLVEFRRGVLISPNSELRRAIRKAIDGRLELFECSAPDGYPDPETVLGQAPDLCLIEVETDTERALALVRDLSDSGLPVVALYTTNDSDLILRALRCGASEFLSEPITPQQLWQAFERLARKNGSGTSRPRPGKIWTIMPAKTNYGATTISCNLAVRLKRLEQRRVLLADMDLLIGSVGFLLKLKSPFSIVDAMVDCAHLDRELWKKLTVSYSSIDVLLGPDKPQLDPAETQAITHFFQFWRQTYGISIVDSPGPVSSWQIALACASDELLLVTTNEVAAVHAAQKTMSLLQSAGVEKSRIRLIVNRYSRENGLSGDAIQTALKTDVYHVLPNDYEPVQKAVLDGKTVSPGCRLGKAVDELCERLTGVARTAKKGWFQALPGVFKKADPCP